MLGLALTPLAAAIQGLFNPGRLFTSGEQGVWYDPSDLTTLFQDSAGTVPVTTVEQPVGLMLDKSKGLVLGAELVTNGTFDTDTTGWIAGGGTIAEVSGQLQITSSGYGAAYQNVALVAGKTYKVTFNYAVGSPNAAALRVVLGYGGGTPVQIDIASTTGQKSLILTWSGATGAARFAVSLLDAAAGKIGYFDNISVKELPGNHATQATSTKRPVLSAKVNLLTGSAALATQSVDTAAIPYTLKHTGTGTITLSGTSTAGPLVGPGTLTFTPTAGTLTLTVTGSVTEAQLETGSVATRYQWVNTVADYDTVGFNKYLKFDGVDDTLVTGSINFTATDKMTVFAGVRKLIDVGIQMLYELSTNTDASVGSFASLPGYLFPGTAGAYFSSGVRGNTASSYLSTAASFPAPISAVQTQKLGISTDTNILRINGTQAASGVADLGTINYGNYPLYIGSRAGTSLPFNGHLYSLIVRGAQSTDAQIVSAESYVNSKTGAY